MNDIKPFAIAVLLFVSPTVIYAQNVPPHALKALAIAAKHYSHDKKQFAQVVEYSTSVPADESGILLQRDAKTRWVSISSLVGVGFVEWSPDGEYVLIDNGTYAIRGFEAISTITGKLVGRIEHRGNEFGWMSSTVVASTTSQGTRADVVDRFGISYFALSQNGVVRQDVLSADELTDYRLLKAADGKLKARKISFKNTGTESPWERYKPFSQIEIALPSLK